MKTITILTIALFVVGAVAIPAMADPDHENDRREAAKDKAADKAAERQDKAEERDEKRAEALAKKDERRNATIAKAEARCDAYENRTGRDVPACDKLGDVHDYGKHARRAAHALMKAIDALEHRVVKLEKMEVRAMDKLEEGNLTENQTAHLEAKLVRIQAAQNKTLEKIEKMEARLENLKQKWDKVRDHVEDQKKVLVCHEGDDGNQTLRIGRHAAPAHLRHGDAMGACPGDESDADLASDEADESSGDDDSSDEPVEEESADDESGSEESSSEDADDDASGDDADPDA